MKKIDNIPEFGIKRDNEKKRDGGCAVIFDPKNQKYAVGKQTNNGLLRLFAGGVDNKEDIKDGVLREVKEESGLYNFLYIEEIAKAISHYHNSLKNINRFAHATCFLIILESNNLKPTQLERHEKFNLEWVTAEEIFKNWESRNKNKNFDHWIYFFKKSVNRAIELGYDITSKLKV